MKKFLHRTLSLLLVLLTAMSLSVWTAAAQDDPSPAGGNLIASGSTGFGQENGSWYYYVNGTVDRSRNDVIRGTVNGQDGWWYVVGGQVQLGYSGVADYANNYGWWYIRNGKVDFSKTGIEQNRYGWWRVVNGRVDFSCNSVEQNDYGWWYLTGGRVRFDYTGLVNYANDYGWWYVRDGKVDFSHSGIDPNDYGWWRVVNGGVDFGYTGVSDFSNDYGWWYIRNGRVDFGKTGIEMNQYGWWRVVNGRVDFSCNSVEQNDYGWWYLTGGQVRFDYTGVADYANACGWWYIKGGKVDFGFSGLGSNRYGTWYVKNGQVDFGFSGAYERGGKTYMVVSGNARDIDAIIQGMSLNQKVAQMFIITPETLSGGGSATAVSSTMEQNYKSYPVGGFELTGSNISTPNQLTALTGGLKSMSQSATGVIPFICATEEGGTVLRIANKSAFGLKDVGNMSAIGATKDTGKAGSAGSTIGSYMSSYGFNVDFAPVADVWTNSSNTVVRYRAFSSDASTASGMVSAFVDGMHSTGLAATLKHFPGHGNTSEDSHTGRAVSDATLSQLRTREFLPFTAGIQSGAEFVMTGHICLPNVTGDYTPATLSKQIITDLLRDELGFDGLVVTDAMEMQAITNYYSSDTAAVMAVQAGCDLILSPEDFVKAYNGVVNAVKSGTISESRINESVFRILKEKAKLGG